MQWMPTMLPDELIYNIGNGLYGDGWRLELIADHRELTAQVAALTKERDDAVALREGTLQQWISDHAALTAERDALAAENSRLKSELEADEALIADYEEQLGLDNN
jgi:hypothetical protein